MDFYHLYVIVNKLRNDKRQFQYYIVNFVQNTMSFTNGDAMGHNCLTHTSQGKTSNRWVRNGPLLMSFVMNGFVQY